jgi:hypothetical protein
MAKMVATKKRQTLVITDLVDNTRKKKDAKDFFEFIIE